MESASGKQVGNDPQYALIAKLKKEELLDAKAAGVKVIEDVTRVSKSLTIAEAADEYWAEIKSHKSRKTFLSYSLKMKLFRELCKKGKRTVMAV